MECWLEESKECFKCQVKKAKLQEQIMGYLPDERMAVGMRPFIYRSLNFLGPLLVKVMAKALTQFKVWPLLFCCLSTGAVHVGVTTLGQRCFCCNLNSMWQSETSPAKSRLTWCPN